ncbi:DHH family phosphoesterase [Pelotalea chapellei]|uniref:Bifunctional oligoribonuclease/PAP phosphatase NrnA n=1 Tax=Pelotalea chapellei TaxID=44671 RepID=A0ABS5U5T4_9BACT|nr:bifunctional oligoribonuclease/PAP phosphatase NrnA [Pelotalea chapellei]MBT1071032.1 bifunctional oligoribonuclease/PAP phosphatase NrnA [Pelotalea chapellei]
MTETIHNILHEISCNQSFLLTTHEGPDGDAVGSTLALASFLRQIGKEVCVHYRDPVPDLYSFLPGAATVQPHIPDQDFDVAFVLDIGELRRAGEEFCRFSRIGKMINLDHHLSCENFGAFNLIDSTAAATGVLVHRIVSAYGFELDFQTALCLYVAIITDTGSFRYSNANREAFTIAGELIDCGVNAWDVAEQLYENQPKKRLELLSLALATLELFKGGLAASVTVTLDMYKNTFADAEFTDGFVNYPRSIKGVEVAVFFRQIEELKFKVGFRSKGKVNVAAFSAALGGGGHHNAAGCTLDGSLEEVKELVYRTVEASL